MSWYSMFKISSLEQAWWQRFYEHLSQTATFVFDNAETSLRPGFSSGIDGPRIFFGFGVFAKNNLYSCGTRLEFSSSLIHSKMQWQHANLQSLFLEPGIGLVKGEWYAIRNLNSEAEVVGRGFILPANASPNQFMSQIKTAIINDNDRDEGDDDEQSISPVPTPPVYQNAPVLR